MNVSLGHTHAGFMEAQDISLPVSWQSWSGIGGAIAICRALYISTTQPVMKLIHLAEGSTVYAGPVQLMWDSIQKKTTCSDANMIHWSHSHGRLERVAAVVAFPVHPGQSTMTYGEEFVPWNCSTQC